MCVNFYDSWAMNARLHHNPNLFNSLQEHPFMHVGLLDDASQHQSRILKFLEEFWSLSRIPIPRQELVPESGNLMPMLVMTTNLHQKSNGLASVSKVTLNFGYTCYSIYLSTKLLMLILCRLDCTLPNSLHSPYLQETPEARSKPSPQSNDQP